MLRAPANGDSVSEFFIVASLRNINFCTFSTLFLGFAFVADAGSPTWEMS